MATRTETAMIDSELESELGSAEVAERDLKSVRKLWLVGDSLGSVRTLKMACSRSGYSTPYPARRSRGSKNTAARL